MKRPDVFFENTGGEGPLSIYWQEGPYGDAVEADDGLGVVFIDDHHQVIAAQFDRVFSDHDHQILTYKNTKIEITTLKGKVVKISKKILRSKTVA